MGGFTSGNEPGFTTAIESEETQIWWSGPNNQHQLSEQSILLDDENTDAGNTPTSTVRGGMILAKETSSGNHYIWDPDATDGRQFVTGVLEKHQDLLVDNTKTNRWITQLSTGLLKASELIQDGDTKGAISLQARASLLRQGFQLDTNGPDGAAFLLHSMGQEFISATTKTLVAADNGKHFIQSAAGNYTLPANTEANVGFCCLITQISDNNLVITSAAGDDIMTKNNDAADSVTFNTATELIGTTVMVKLIHTAASTRKWLVFSLGDTTMGDGAG
jgi:hypothetical protein